MFERAGLSWQHQAAVVSEQTRLQFLSVFQQYWKAGGRVAQRPFPALSAR